ncbi:MAG: SRPBCC family protein [Chloroflexi bacterium]|nr:SRPBCC family protein [Chloroflexota bacterium]
MDFRVETVINAPASEAWTVLGERFADIGDWAAPITASSLEGDLRHGAVRTCHTARFGPVPAGTIKEQLIEYDPASMSFAYEAVDGMPGFFERATSHWSVHPLGGERCLVRTHATVTLRGPATLLSFLLRRNLQTVGARVLDELRHQVEHGQPHPRKVSAMVKMAPVR